MSDPTRLLEGDSDLERGILRAWSARQPSDGARLRTLTAVGVGSLALATGLGSAGAGTSVAPKAIVASSSLFKWLALAGVVAGGVAATAGSVAYVNLHDKPVVPVTSPTTPQTTPQTKATTLAKPPPEPRANPVIPAPSSTTEPAEPPEATPAEPPEATPAEPAAPSSPTSMVSPTLRAMPSVGNPSAASTVTASTKTAPATTSALDEQVSTIDQARRALASGDANGALALVTGYDARFPDGALSQESAEVRIEALYRLGNRAEADKLATRFLAAHPASPYARVVRSLQGGAHPE